eukprot:CAMPEP_0113889876 /NCGR_PEP_ID=MMETSP0780_2-20120614/13785_1 /TAXON_ID=652834 /ORGANISM="Palpitomonas bilix" /LENGTH=66 /DNA_ID=CAMNT_0000879113 /DNA_START=223 /DNA_END=421 /DNA_ORIENTATION=- /assembly_acc=CAM_ASM_000599
MTEVEAVKQEAMMKKEKMQALSTGGGGARARREDPPAPVLAGDLGGDEEGKGGLRPIRYIRVGRER